MGKRDISLDIAKGIGILLMVIGHTGCPGWLHDGIYSFHMPLFFILSGLCLSDKRIDGSIKAFVKNRIQRLYIPFIKYGFFFYGIDTLLSIISNGGGNVMDILKDCALILAMIQTPALVSCYWFLAALFVSSIVTVLVLKLAKRYAFRMLWSGVLLLLLIVVFFQRFNIHLSVLVSYKTPYYAAFIICGYLMKNSVRKFSFKCKSLIGLICVLFCAIPFVSLNLHTSTTSATEILTIFVLSIIGSLGTILISQDIADHTTKLANGLRLLGERTMDILTWHFSGLRIMNVIIVLAYALSQQEIMAFPCISTNPWYWFAYVPFAIAFSLAVGKLMRLISRRLSNL